MLIIWLQGIWLPLHGYNYNQMPLWADAAVGRRLLAARTAGFLVSGPAAGSLSDRIGPRGVATAGSIVFGVSFIGWLWVPVSFPYWIFAPLIAANGIASGIFAAPNSSSIMGSFPARQRGAASGMWSTFQNSGTALSLGVFFSLMIAGLAVQVAPGGPRGSHRPHVLPSIMSGPFHHGLLVVMTVSAALAAVCVATSLLGGPRDTEYSAQRAARLAGASARRKTVRVPADK